MKAAARLSFAVVGCAGLAGFVLWWLADHRRGIAWAVSVVRARFPDVSHLSPSSLDAWLHGAQRSAPQVVDARSEEEFETSHLPGARRMDPESTASTALASLDAERPVVIYCSAGHRAATLARRLQGAGRHDVWNLEGGIFAWANSSLPLESAGQPVHRVHFYIRIFSRLLKPQKRHSSP